MSKTKVMKNWNQQNSISNLAAAHYSSQEDQEIEYPKSTQYGQPKHGSRQPTFQHTNVTSSSTVSSTAETCGSSAPSSTFSNSSESELLPIDDGYSSTGAGSSCDEDGEESTGSKNRTRMWVCFGLGFFSSLIGAFLVWLEHSREDVVLQVSTEFFGVVTTRWKSAYQKVTTSRYGSKTVRDMYVIGEREEPTLNKFFHDRSVSSLVKNLKDLNDLRILMDDYKHDKDHVGITEGIRCLQLRTDLEKLQIQDYERNREVVESTWGPLLRKVELPASAPEELKKLKADVLSHLDAIKGKCFNFSTVIYLLFLVALFSVAIGCDNRRRSA